MEKSNVDNFYDNIKVLEPHIPKTMKWIILGLMQDINRLQTIDKKKLVKNDVEYFNMFLRHRMDEFNFLHNLHSPQQTPLRKLIGNQAVPPANLKYDNYLYRDWKIHDNPELANILDANKA